MTCTKVKSLTSMTKRSIKMKVEHNDIIFTKKELATLKEAQELLRNIGSLLRDNKDLAKGYCYKAADVWSIVSLMDDITWYANTED